MALLTIILLIIIFIIGIAAAYWIGHKTGHQNRESYWLEQVPLERRDAITKSRAILGGQFSEQLAPYLPDFKHLPTEARFIGKPIDFLIFKGLDEKKVDEVVFVEVKSGNAKTSPVEKSLKDTIDNKRVRWEEYRIPEGVTKKKDDNI